MKKNGEAVYGAYPWKVYGENLQAVKEMEEKVNTLFHDPVYDGTPKEILPDFRYTAKDKAIYVIVRNIPQTDFILNSFRGEGGIKRVTFRITNNRN